MVWRQRTYCLASMFPEPKSLQFLLLISPSFVYETPVTTEEDLTAQIAVASAVIASTPTFFEHVLQSFVR
ncbi:hypothetical protein TNCV_3477771 [Trichonephila clavipes]|nr:hypothetical protein TNCV_3477771 [Trichonephila clavipes]